MTEPVLRLCYLRPGVYAKDVHRHPHSAQVKPNIPPEVKLNQWCWEISTTQRTPPLVLTYQASRRRRTMGYV
jgi:hypothetical protein